MSLRVLFHHPHSGPTSEPLAVALAVFTGRYQLLSYFLFIFTTGTTSAVLLKRAMHNGLFSLPT